MQVPEWDGEVIDDQGRTVMVEAVLAVITSDPQSERLILAMVLYRGHF